MTQTYGPFPIPSSNSVLPIKTSVVFRCVVCNRIETPKSVENLNNDCQVEALLARGWYDFLWNSAQICWACISEMRLEQGWKRSNETESENVDTKTDQGPILEDSSG